MGTKNLRYDILSVVLKKVFLVRFEQINDQISTCEKILEKDKKIVESLLFDFKRFSSYLSDSQVDKIKKEVESISRTYYETSYKLESLLEERRGLQIVVSLYEDLLDIRLLIIEIKHPLLLEEYSALQYKITQLRTEGLKTSEEDLVLELLIKKKQIFTI